MRVLSGIQPSGALHIGNYFGALKQFLDLQRDHDAYYFVADYHALTSLRDAALLRRLHLRRDCDHVGARDSTPRKRHYSCSPTCRKQRSWPGCSRPSRRWAGWRSASATKTRSSRGFPPSTGSLPIPCCRRPTSCYTTLISFRSARTKSSTWKSPVTSPSGSTELTAAARKSFGCPSRTSLTPWPVVPGVDGRKMSKSYNNTIDIFDDPAVIRKKVKKIVTDSTPVEAPKNPDTCPLFSLYKLFAADDERAEVERRYREGGIGYGEVKTRLAESIIARFATGPRTASRVAGALQARRSSPLVRRGSRKSHRPTSARSSACRLRSGVNFTPYHESVYEIPDQVYNDALTRGRASHRADREMLEIYPASSPLSAQLRPPFQTACPNAWVDAVARLSGSFQFHLTHDTHVDPGGVMDDFFGPESGRDLIRRGFSRRDFGRLAAFLTAGAALPFYNEAALAQGLSAMPNLPPDAVRINANENPMGPCPEAAEAIHKVVSPGGALPLQRDLRVRCGDGRDRWGVKRSCDAVCRIERPTASRGFGVHQSEQELRRRRAGI